MKSKRHARFFEKNQSHYISDKAYQSLFSTNGSAFGVNQNRNVKKHSCRACHACNIYSLSVADANCRGMSRLFRVAPLELNRHSRLDDRMSANALSAGAGVTRQREFRQSAPRDTLGAGSSESSVSAQHSNVYARLSAFRRRSTRDATRRRASPASACVASPDAKTAKKPDTSAERNARTTVRKAVAVTTKREKTPTGCHEEWQGGVIDSSTIATS